jgi:hypothetical protein
MNMTRILSVAALVALTCSAPAELKFKAQKIDDIEIGYGIQITDVDGDGRTDIVLADKKTIQWYQAPAWQKHIIAKDLTERDNVCITARDTDGDGKCEIAVGAQWNPGNTTDENQSGAVFALTAPQDRTKTWRATKLENEPTVHRMHWIRSTDDNYSFVVKPLHGRGNKAGEGKGGLVWEYHPPASVKGSWQRTLVSDFLHLSHNFHIVNWDKDAEEELLLAGKEGVWLFDKRPGKWHRKQLTDKAVGEIRNGRLPNGKRFIVTIEPHHGIAATVYVETAKGLWKSTRVLDNELVAGHALQVADLLGTGNDQIVVGWRGQGRKGKPGIKLFSPANRDGTKWNEQQISGEEVAIEDLKVADLNNDGKIDIVAAGRQTKNLVIFWNSR